MFYPGETERHIFVLPFSALEVSEAVASYKQRGKVVLTIEATTFTVINESSCKFEIELTQEDTLKFQDNEEIYVQVNVKGESGGRLTSAPMVLKCGEQSHRRQI